MQYAAQVKDTLREVKELSEEVRLADESSTPELANGSGTTLSTNGSDPSTFGRGTKADNVVVQDLEKLDLGSGRSNATPSEDQANGSSPENLPQDPPAEPEICDFCTGTASTSEVK